MASPFDLENLFGLALADGLRRAGLLIGCVAVASFLAALSLGCGEMVADGGFDPSRLPAAMGGMLWLFLAPFLSAWAILYLPLLITLGFYSVKAEAPDGRVCVLLLFLLGMLIVLSAPRPDWFAPSWYGIPMGGGVADPDKAALIWRSVGAVIVTGCSGGLFWLAWILRQRSQAASEQHFVGVAIENDLRRQRMRDTFGTDIADRDYVADDD
jgi:hypothetical protein